MALLTGEVRRIEPPAPDPTPDRAPDWVAGGTPEPLRSRLGSALGSDRVLYRALDLIAYASDASPYRQIPQAVARPHDVDDVVKLFAFARDNRTPLVFRAGGTSLNGQAQTDSILVDSRRHWSRVRVKDGGRTVRVEPGVVLGHVNRLLARHDRKLGPDPASTDIACVGGVVANNSGGMRCGIVADSYRTVRALTFVLPNGAVIDTAAPEAEERFAAAAPELASGLSQIRDELRADRELAERVAHKFEIKNTTGYRLCAFLDAESPLEIFRRLIIGSEGTLAFVAEVVFDTVPFGRHATVALALFEDLDGAAEAVGPLVAAGASATELMVAPTLIAASYNMPGTPERWKTLPPEAAALLVEFRNEDAAELDAAEAAGLEILSGREQVDPPAFTRDRHEIEMLWHVREGMHGLVASIRPPGVSLIVEDVCVPPARVAQAARDLQQLLGQHGFLPGLAGHASAGNLHFMLSPNFGEAADLERYEAFMHDMVELIITKYDGSLKAEHGTGVNMAPYVEREWGTKATELMWRIKRLADPDGILAPGVVFDSRRRRPSAQPQVDTGDRGGRHEVHRVRVLRAGVPVAQRDNDATPAHRAAARDGATAGRIAGDAGSARAVRVRRHRDVRGRRVLPARLPGGDRRRPADQGLPPPRAWPEGRGGRRWGGAPLRRARAGGSGKRPGRCRRVSSLGRPACGGASGRPAARREHRRRAGVELQHPRRGARPAALHAP